MMSVCTLGWGSRSQITLSKPGSVQARLSEMTAAHGSDRTLDTHEEARIVGPVVSDPPGV
jgi:hypothetical protein